MTWADIFWTVASIVAFAVFISVVVMGLTYLERRVMARFHSRRGPNRVGPFGLLQPVADAIKLLTKEDLLPARADKLSFWIAPLVVFVPGFMVWITVPFTRNVVVQNLELGLFYILAVSGVSIVGLLMAGWSSFNKYSMLGGARAAAQLISYELPLVLGALGIVMVAQSADLRQIVVAQGVWFILIQPLAFILVFLSGLAEVGRTPFDIPYAESEIIGGPFIEYSGIHWAMFYLAEYANTFLVAVLTTLLFLGGWRGFNPATGFGAQAIMAAWFFAKAFLVILIIIWIRMTIPRFRIDQLMALAWKVFVPLSFVNVLLTAVAMFYRWPNWTMTAMSLAAIGITWYFIVRARKARGPLPTFTMVHVAARKAGASPPDATPSLLELVKPV